MEQIKLFLFIALLWSFSAYGGGVSSGGGLGVVYKDGSVIDKVVLLDLYRNRTEGFGSGKNKRKYTIDPKLGNKAFKEVIHEDGLRWFEGLENQFGSEAREIIIDVWKRIDSKLPRLAAAILQMQDSFGDWDLEPAVCQTNDFGQTLDLKGGKLKNIACRELKTIRLDHVLFNALSPRHKAALWLHEMLYGLSSHADSVLIQELVAYFMSKEFLNESSGNLESTLRERFKIYYPGEVPSGIELSGAGISFSLLHGGPTTNFYNYPLFFEGKEKVLNKEIEYICGKSIESEEGLQLTAENGEVHQIPLSEGHRGEFQKMVDISRKFLRTNYPRVLYPTSWVQDRYFTCFEKEEGPAGETFLDLRFVQVRMSTLAVTDKMYQDRAKFGARSSFRRENFFFEHSAFVGHIQYIVNFN